MKSVLAAVVTHNRPILLSRCINFIQAQTYRDFEILVVDNGSTVDTKELIKSKNINAIYQDNTGSAGGWYAAIEYFLSKDFEFIWLMDDDGFPEKSSLENLIDNYQKDFSCISSIVINDDDKKSLVFPLPRLNKSEFPALLSFKKRFKTIDEIDNLFENNLYPYIHPFNGVLIPRATIKKIGNVNKELFIMGDEVDYACRMKEAGKSYTLVTSLHFHPDISKREWSQTKFYYFIKNSIILNFRYFDYPFLRSLKVVASGILKVLTRNSLKTNLDIFFKKNLLFRAILAAIYKRIGKDF